MEKTNRIKLAKKKIKRKICQKENILLLLVFIVVLLFYCIKKKLLNIICNNETIYLIKKLERLQGDT